MHHLYAAPRAKPVGRFVARSRRGWAGPRGAFPPPSAGETERDRVGKKAPWAAPASASRSPTAAAAVPGRLRGGIGHLSRSTSPAAMQRPEGKQPWGAFSAGEPSGRRGAAAELGGRRRPCPSADGSVSTARRPPTEAPRCSLDGAPGDLAEELREFDAVLDAFSPGAQERRFPGEEPPERRRSGDAAQRESLFRCDAQGADSLYRNSFGFSDGKLNSPAVSTPTVASRKGKLGDTKELEDFIADLDRTLASM